MTDTARFVHLNAHSEYSMVDSVIRIKDLVKAAKADGQVAIALTDHHNFFAAVKFYKAALSAGIKPIFGADLYYHRDDDATPHKITCLCMNDLGYKNLTLLISRAYLEGQQQGKPFIQHEWLNEAALQGLIVLSGGQQGEIGHYIEKGKLECAQETVAHWQQLLPGRFYLELSILRQNEGEKKYIETALQLATTHGVPVVATNSVRFLRSDDFTAHEARVAIHDGYVLIDPNRPKHYSEAHYLKSQQAMRELFSAVPEACDNTVEIARRCQVHLNLGEVYLPDFPVPEGMTIASYLTKFSEDGLKLRFPEGFKDEAEQKAYEDRLKVELEVIINMGFPGYFLIVADFIQWAKDHGIPVGPGRGSGAGSLVAYVLQITDLDPLKYNLLFERFLNPERVSMPDFDIDFCMERRDEVIHYVADKYGRDCVSQIITYGSMAAKAVVRDVGRVLSHPYGFVDKLAKLIPFEVGITLRKAMEEEPELLRRYEEEDDVHELMELALKLEGLTRNAGKHAGGVVIAPSKLTDFAPIYCEEGGKNVVTQFDKDDVEQIGLVKFDFLGLRTLTIIQWACENIERLYHKKVNINEIPLDDDKSFDLLKECLTTAVFQLESRGMKDLIHRLQPDCFEDIVALVALFRPGPLQSGMVDDFINRKKGLAAIEYPHPELEPILFPTYGVILYQEQVMQIAQVLAGYSLGAADLLRRAMGKKKPEEMAKQRTIFLEGATNRDIDEDLAGSIFDLMEKFAGYGFNKSHSAAYALIAYQTAWLKAHYPACFMAAVLSSDMDNTDKVVHFLDDLKQLDIAVIPPSVNASHYHFTVQDEKAILFGLGAIKGVGEAAINIIIQEREHGGPYKDYMDFFTRVDLGKVNKRTIEALIYSGAMDCLSMSRGELLANIEVAIAQANKARESQRIGQGDLFSEGGVQQDFHLLEAEDLHFLEKVQKEKATLGFFLSGHPYDYYKQELSAVIKTSLGALPRDKSVTVAGLVVGVRYLVTKRGKRFAIATIADGQVQVDVTVFSEVLETCQALLVKDQLIIVSGESNWDDYSQGMRVVAKEVTDLIEFRNRHLKCLKINLSSEQDIRVAIKQIQAMLGEINAGKIPVRLTYSRADLACDLNLPSAARIQLDETAESMFKQYLPDTNIDYIYD